MLDCKINDLMELVYSIRGEDKKLAYYIFLNKKKEVKKGLLIKIRSGESWARFGFALTDIF